MKAWLELIFVMFFVVLAIVLAGVAFIAGPEHAAQGALFLLLAVGITLIYRV